MPTCGRLSPRSHSWEQTHPPTPSPAKVPLLCNGPTNCGVICLYKHLAGLRSSTVRHKRMAFSLSLCSVAEKEKEMTPKCTVAQQRGTQTNTRRHTPSVNGLCARNVPAMRSQRLKGTPEVAGKGSKNLFRGDDDKTTESSTPSEIIFICILK